MDNIHLFNKTFKREMDFFQKDQKAAIDISYKHCLTDVSINNEHPLLLQQVFVIMSPGMEASILAEDMEKKREDPRVKRTRKLLSQAFLELMQEKGFQAITVQDIADRAGVNRATFYAHYEDKFDLLDSYSREGFRDWLAQKIPDSGSFQIKHLSRLVLTVFEFLTHMETHCGQVDAELAPMMATMMQEELCSYLRNWFSQSPAALSPLQHPPETVAMVWSWAILGTALQWSQSPRKFSQEQLAAQVVEVLITPLKISRELVIQAVKLPHS
jgi:AcrR family transcriptional regulator